MLGISDHKTGITIEFALKFDAICMYICPNSRNYHIRLLQSQNRYLSSLESIQSPILKVCVSSMDTLRSSIFNSGMLIGHPPDFNIKTMVSLLETLQSSIFSYSKLIQHLRSSIPNSGELIGHHPESTFNYSKLIGHPPEFNIQLR